MSTVLLVQPWNFHDEGVREHNLERQWRNGPYSLLLLATTLRRAGHQVRIVDMLRDLVALRGDVDACLSTLRAEIRAHRPDIIGFGFFSIHYFETKRAVEAARHECERCGIDAMFIAGGIHASTEPSGTCAHLGFDYAFKGEADIGLVKLADGDDPRSVPGVFGAHSLTPTSGEEAAELDALPFPDWSLCDHEFYSHPTYARMQIRKTRSLDMIMSRGCVYQCKFCAYNALSSFRYHSAEYLVEQMRYMLGEFDCPGVYFTDSTIGNNRRVVVAFCERMIETRLSDRMEWYANIRPNQVNEKVLKLMWRAGCRYLFYGFESGSQRMLDAMGKSIRLEYNYKAAELHNRLGFPYHASMLLGYPGETEADIKLSMQFLEDVQPPSIGINWYVPLPGSPDYDSLRERGVISTDDPNEWRLIGEVNKNRVYADVPEPRFRELFAETERLAYKDIPKRPRRGAWGCLAPAGSGVGEAIESKPADAPDLDDRSRATFGTVTRSESRGPA